MPTTTTTNNTLEGNAEDNAKVAFRDFIESIVLNINGKVKDDPYYGRFERGNPIYEYFLEIDRKSTIRKLREHFQNINCNHTNCPIITFKTAAEHQPDWLFDRFYLDLKDRYDDEFEAKTYNLIDEIESRELKRIFKHEKGHDFLKPLPRNKFHLFHINIDIDNDDDKLNEFLIGFCNYWKEKPLDTKCLIFLSIKLRKMPKPSFFEKVFSRKKINRLLNSQKTESPIQNMYLLEELELVEQTEIERFFENHLKCFPNNKDIKSANNIKDCWILFANEIDKIIAARQKN